jgi:polyisoprenoid-binding protein YceI
MNHFKRTFNTLLCLLLVSVSLHSAAAASWALSNEQSALTFISTKNQHFSESHHFSQLSGNLSKQGQLSIEIDLASVQSGIGIRDTRMQESLFMVEQFPKASLSATLPIAVMQLKAGESVLLEIPASLKIMTLENEIKVKVQITKTTGGEFIATSTEAILISANDYGLKEGLLILQKLAGLSSIGQSVPVSFNVVFAQQ